MFSSELCLFSIHTEMPPAIATNLHHTIGGNNLNINLPENNAVLRLEVELRDKNARRRPNYRNKGHAGDRIRAASPANGAAHPTPPNPNHFFIPMEKVRSIFGLLFCTFMVIIDPLVLLLNLTLNTFASAKLPKAFQMKSHHQFAVAVKMSRIASNLIRFCSASGNKCYLLTYQKTHSVHLNK